MTILFVIVKILFITYWLKESFAFEYFLTGHLLLNFGFILSLKNKIKHGGWLLSLYLIDTLIPIFGFVVLAIFYILYPLYKKIYQTKDQIDHPSNELDDPEFDKYSNIKKVKIEKMEIDNFENKLHESIKIQPYIDILRGNDIDLKISACIKLSQFKDQQSIKLLKTALQDENYEVRYMANNTLGSIEQEYLSEIESLSENIHKYPTHLNYFIERGNLYLWMQQMGLLDPIISEQFMQKALADFRHSIKMQPDSYHLYLRIAQCYVNLGLYKDLTLLVEKATKLELNQEIKSKLYFYRAEASFQLKDFNALTKDIDQIDDLYLDYDRTKEALTWWRDEP